MFLLRTAVTVLYGSRDCVVIKHAEGTRRKPCGTNERKRLSRRTREASACKKSRIVTFTSAATATAAPVPASRVFCFLITITIILFNRRCRAAQGLQSVKSSDVTNSELSRVYYIYALQYNIYIYRYDWLLPVPCAMFDADIDLHKRPDKLKQLILLFFPPVARAGRGSRPLRPRPGTDGFN